ncbi:(2Fe-2S)-binding protein [Labrys sp. 22185]|uniref:(2Fe-2S)-binding protein n=1 Tax=Labrys sp. 22185 TaxID=3453888 RepID=UPI003F83E647
MGETDRTPVAILINGESVSCLAGDTLLTAILLNGRFLRHSEFGDGPRAGFCNMGACQDCWLTLASGERIRACTTEVRDGMVVLTREAR